jgi:hypothetical protein
MKLSIQIQGVLGVLISAVASQASLPEASAAPKLELKASSAERFIPGDWQKLWWRQERDRRDASLQQYLEANNADWLGFKNTPLVANGVPLVMLKVLPLMFPDIWGDEFLSNTGMQRDSFEPTRTLPIGLGAAPTIQLTPTFKMSTANITCMTCHTGKVTLGDGTHKLLVGAPGTTFTGFRAYLEKSAIIAPDPAHPERPSWSVNGFRAAIQNVIADPNRGLAWFYGSSPESVARAQIEAGVFLSNDALAAGLVTQVQQRILGLRALIQGSLGAHTYGPRSSNPPDINAPTPGFMDAIGAGLVAVMFMNGNDLPTIIAGVPPVPAMVDIPSVWKQEDRVVGQWDGSIRSQLHRNLSPGLVVASSPASIDYVTASASTRFIQNLPSPAYPFDVELVPAIRGAVLYQVACASCHGVKSDRLFTDTGTDMNRTRIWTDIAMTALRTQTRQICPISDPACDVPDEDIVRSTGGYVAPPLDGIWARAPYLHNGSVPTIEHLLTGRRPAQFYRGNTAYDQRKMGFVYDDPTQGVLFDTTKDGLSNTGHDTRAYNGNIDWRRGTHLKDLIEYLKTL